MTKSSPPNLLILGTTLLLLLSASQALNVTRAEIAKPVNYPSDSSVNFLFWTNVTLTKVQDLLIDISPETSYFQFDATKTQCGTDQLYLNITNCQVVSATRLNITITSTRAQSIFAIQVANVTFANMTEDGVQNLKFRRISPNDVDLTVPVPIVVKPKFAPALQLLSKIIGDPKSSLLLTLTPTFTINQTSNVSLSLTGLASHLADPTCIEVSHANLRVNCILSDSDTLEIHNLATIVGAIQILVTDFKNPVILGQSLNFTIACRDAQNANLATNLTVKADESSKFVETAAIEYGIFRNHFQNQVFAQKLTNKTGQQLNVSIDFNFADTLWLANVDRACNLTLNLGSSVNAASMLVVQNFTANTPIIQGNSLILPGCGDVGLTNSVFRIQLQKLTRTSVLDNFTVSAELFTSTPTGNYSLIKTDGPIQLDQDILGFSLRAVGSEQTSASTLHELTILLPNYVLPYVTLNIRYPPSFSLAQGACHVQASTNAQRDYNTPCSVANKTVTINGLLVSNLAITSLGDAEGVYVKLNLSSSITNPSVKGWATGFEVSASYEENIGVYTQLNYKVFDISTDSPSIFQTYFVKDIVIANDYFKISAFATNTFLDSTEMRFTYDTIQSGVQFTMNVLNVTNNSTKVRITFPLTLRSTSTCQVVVNNERAKVSYLQPSTIEFPLTAYLQAAITGYCADLILQKERVMRLPAQARIIVNNSLIHQVSEQLQVPSIYSQSNAVKGKATITQASDKSSLSVILQVDNPIMDKDNITISLDDFTFALLSNQTALTFKPILNFVEIQGYLKSSGKDLLLNVRTVLPQIPSGSFIQFLIPLDTPGASRLSSPNSKILSLKRGDLISYSVSQEGGKSDYTRASLGCSSNQYASRDGFCLDCVDGCKRCSDLFTCQECNTRNYALNPLNNLCVKEDNCGSGEFYDYESGACKVCTIKNCKKCLTETTCESCNSNYDMEIGSGQSIQSFEASYDEALITPLGVEPVLQFGLIEAKCSLYPKDASKAYLIAQNLILMLGLASLFVLTY
ncbi:hypothetical protein FGO68_gene8370 [Halteria grandinella]|uniref:Uncharacterized protein n=1 Tax=Halteria grandinella TaxID=5974 RepID=A0A8J8P2R3_HALGN|nr:hypothetical protein FGO68_gene8370 [Halteria grandinella]